MSPLIMETFLLIPVLLLMTALCVYLYRRRMSDPLREIPGPRGWPILGNALEFSTPKRRYVLRDWSKQHGSVYKINLFGSDVVILSGIEAITQAMVTQGSKSAGRPRNFRLQYLFQGLGFGRSEPDRYFKIIRKVAHTHMKQFGEGLQHIEDIVCDISEEMYAVFSSSAEKKKPIDPLTVLEATALKIIAYIICGERITDKDNLFQYIMDHQSSVFKVLNGNYLSMILVDIIPFCVHLPLTSSKVLKAAVVAGCEVKREIVRRARRYRPEQSLAGRLLQHVKETAGESVSDRDMLQSDPIPACSDLLGAGVGTTSLTMYCFINLLAHHPHIQTKLLQEIRSMGLSKTSRVSLNERSRMPYARAAVLETLRYHSVSPLGFRRTTEAISVLGFTIPKDTTVFPNLFNCHHDECVWGDPENFRPERFLDDAGELLAADHILRRQMVPFSLGIRMCPAEQLARARLFLWATNLVNRFIVHPAPGNQADSVRADMFEETSIVVPSKYEVVFESRV